MKEKTATKLMMDGAPTMLEHAMRTQKPINRIPGLRGASEVTLFAGEMVKILNRPRNIAKGDWESMTWNQVIDKVFEECAELVTQMMFIATGSAPDNGDLAYRFAEALCQVREQPIEGLHGILKEAPDLGNVAMMAFDKARRELYGEE